MLNFAIVGCGRISKNHIEALINNLDSCKLDAVCDIDENKAIERKEQYERNVENTNVKVYTDYIKMVESEDIDAVSICTESGYHAKIAIDCLNRGKHVLIEKPMALSLEDADRIIVLNDGKIDGFGTHQELLNSNDIYREVYESQVKGDKDNE